MIFSCSEKETTPIKCQDANTLAIDQRDFHMGFTTWPYGPELADVVDTYNFIESNADIYAHHLDNKIPWKAWINDTAIPDEFVNDINYRIANKIESNKLLLSISLLNTDRDDLLEDYDGSRPTYTALNDKQIEDAYFKHVDFLISRFQPDYVVLAIEVNELMIKPENKWDEYVLLMNKVRTRIKNKYPNIPQSESITLHNWFNPNVSNPEEFIAKITQFVNNLDFVCISYYPYFKEQHTRADFQEAFDFLHEQTQKPIAFVETANLAEDLYIDALNVDIKSNTCEQSAYLNTLLQNAQNHNYEFIIWWAHRDYDALWETFPDEVKDIGKIWKDTGLLDENGNERPAYHLWKKALELESSN
ncbi:glycosyl hydrolase 53 family protein [Carboxylicivirga sp. N1Y90]|uniref:glycosyl hydrolase 53 family protein n=1 Tax=Carboxylicivirga fragile TaxID=3417571 RepID=UPI003D33C4EE